MQHSFEHLPCGKAHKSLTLGADVGDGLTKQEINIVWFDNLDFAEGLVRPTGHWLGGRPPHSPCPKSPGPKASSSNSLENRFTTQKAKAITVPQASTPAEDRTTTTSQNGAPIKSLAHANQILLFADPPFSHPLHPSLPPDPFPPPPHMTRQPDPTPAPESKFLSDTTD